MRTGNPLRELWHMFSSDDTEELSSGELDVRCRRWRELWVFENLKNGDPSWLRDRNHR